MITGCTFVGNTADRGGAIYWIVGDPTDVGRITNCRFEGNTATFGGAVYVVDGSPLISCCVMIGNEAIFGGAIFNGPGFAS